MDGIKEFFEALGSRVKSPILGSVLISFIVINWKVLFFVLFAKVKAVDKFEYFDANTGLTSLFVIPLVSGLALAIASPWIKLGGMHLAKTPREKMKALQHEIDNANLIRKQESTLRIKTLLTTQEEALIEQVKRDQGITQDIQDEDKKAELQKQIDALRADMDSSNYDDKIKELPMLSDMPEKNKNSLEYSRLQTKKLAQERDNALLKQQWNEAGKLESERLYHMALIAKIMNEPSHNFS